MTKSGAASERAGKNLPVVDRARRVDMQLAVTTEH
jgi:hypothetical protein